MQSYKSSVLILYLSLLYSCKGNGAREDFVDLVTSEAAPWEVLVLPNNNKLFCSGVLVGWEWVLTAAHCMFTVSGIYTEHDQSVTVVAGSSRGEASNNTQARQSKKLWLHDSYTFTENFIHDLILIQVQQKFTASARVNVAPLIQKNRSQKLVASSNPTNEAEHVTFSGTVYGFGLVSRGTKSAKDNSLKSQDFQVSRHCQCLRRVRSARSTHSILNTEETLLCRVLPRPTGLCDGDNGGPLFTNGVLRGLATTLVHYTGEHICQLSEEHHECGDTRTVSVFTDLCLYGEWISKLVPGYPNTDDSCQVWESV